MPFDKFDPLELLQKFRSHSPQYTLEELYVQMLIVSQDLYLNQLEMGIWWILLEKWAPSSDIHLLTSMYCCGCFAKQAFGMGSVVDSSYIENNFVENFNKIYTRWCLNKYAVGFDDWKQAKEKEQIIAKFLRRDLDLCAVVGGIISEQTASISEIQDEIGKKQSEDSSKSCSSCSWLWDEFELENQEDEDIFS